MENIWLKFISATTPLTILPLYYVANTIEEKNYDIFRYVMTAPIWLGFLNVIWSIMNPVKDIDFYYMTLVPVSIICSFIIVKVSNAYPTFRKEHWIQYYMGMIIGHTLFWYVGVRNIEKLLVSL